MQLVSLSNNLNEFLFHEMEVDDFVHGKFFIPRDISLIINTPQYQRLKKVKQLGLLYKCLPNAIYTRYEHSLGTYFLTRTMIDCLEKNSDWIEKNVTDSELEKYKFYRKAVELAALLHDIGHGPFSHVWEGIVSKYNHEENAENCIDDIFNILNPETLPEFRLDNNFGIELIKALIIGEHSRLSSTSFEPKYHFLFEIVHNAQCELDVDKLDYLKHDTYFAKSILDGFEHLSNELDNIEDVFFKARISENGQHIEYRYEDYDKIYKLFEARNRLHVKFYRMPKVMACDYLLKKIIQSEDFRIDGISVTKIRSRPTETFLKFIDEEILHLVSNHKLFPYLKNPERITQVDKSEAQLHDPLVFEVKAMVKGAGAQMPPDDRFHFYGEADLKPSIKRDLNNHSLYHCFRLL